MMRLFAIVVALIVTLLIGACTGFDWETPVAILEAVLKHASIHDRLIVDWRLPRVLSSASVGFLLGLSGAIFQGVFRNPLAEPYLLGSAGGAALGATVALLVPLGVPSALSLPVLSFAGAWTATALVLAVARLAGTRDVATLLLAGVAVAAVLTALRSFLMLSLSDETVNLQIVLSWLLGGVQTPSWAGLGLLGLFCLCAFGLSLPLCHKLDLLGLGDDMAVPFGLDVDAFVMRAVFVGSLVVAVAVAYGGVVAFVGLAAPHVARRFVGPLHGMLLPASALVGLIFVVLADALARSVLPPAEIPIGLVTSIFGAPFFIAILAQQRSST